MSEDISTEMAFPTHVGVILKNISHRDCNSGFPHTCGGDPTVGVIDSDYYKLSPHVGVIPSSQQRKLMNQSFPHTCGGDPL